MSEERTLKKMNIGQIMRFIWHDSLRRIKILSPIINTISQTHIFIAITKYIDYKCDIYDEHARVPAQAYFEENIERVENIKSKLSDEKSRVVYDRMIQFRCTHDPKYLRGIADKNQYFDRELIKFTDKEIFVDCGAYTGDTMMAFLRNLREGGGKFKEIIGFEPDRYNYLELTKWLKTLPGGGMVA